MSCPPCACVLCVCVCVCDIALVMPVGAVYKLGACCVCVCVCVSGVGQGGVRLSVCAHSIVIIIAIIMPHPTSQRIWCFIETH